MMLSYLNHQNFSAPTNSSAFRLIKREFVLTEIMRLTCSFFLFQQSDHIPDLGAPSMARTLASVFEVLAKMTLKRAEHSKEHYGRSRLTSIEKGRKGVSKKDEEEREEEKVQ